MIKIYNHRRSLYTLTKQIKKSIKDKENMLSFELWTCGDYGATIPLSSNNIRTYKSHEWSTNADNSYKAVISQNSHVQYCGFTLTNLNEDAMLNVSCDIKTQVPLTFVMFQNINDQWSKAGSVNIPVGETLNINLSKTVEENTQTLWIRFDCSDVPEDTTFNIDNFSVKII